MWNTNDHFNEQGDLQPLHFAADRGFADVCLALLAKRANINALDGDCQTPLMIAAIGGKRVSNIYPKLNHTIEAMKQS